MKKVLLTLVAVIFIAATQAQTIGQRALFYINDDPSAQSMYGYFEVCPGIVCNYDTIGGFWNVALFPPGAPVGASTVDFDVHSSGTAYFQLVPEWSFVEGDGIDVDVTNEVVTISLEEPELAPGAPMKNGLMPLVLKTEIFDMSGNLVEEIKQPGEYIVWNYLSTGEIEKTHVVTK